MADAAVVALALVALGLVLLMVEAFSPGVFLVIPGTVLLAVGVLGFAAPDFLFTWKSPVVAAAVALPVTAATVYLYRYLGRPEPPSTTVADSLVGRSGTVVADVSPDDLKGKVRVGTDVWSADSDEPIPEGAEVVVDGAAGVHIHVRRARF